MDAPLEPVTTPPPGPDQVPGIGAAPRVRDEATGLPAGARVLLVDGDDKARRTVKGLLEEGGHAVLEALDGRAGLRVFYDARPDLVVFDLALSDLNGWQLLARIRELSDAPIMIVRSRGRSDLERVRALRSGADDVLDKPVNGQEFLARVEGLLRRARADTATAVYADGFIQVDFPQRAVTAGGREVGLSPLEFRMLTAFIRHPNEVLDRDRLRELVWGGVRGVLPSRVKLYVSYLRKKVGLRPDGTSPIETVRGFGYIYRSEGAAPRE